MLRSQFLLEVAGDGAADAAASLPLHATSRNLEEPTTAKICAHCVVTVSNTSERIVSFKVLTNAQNRYSIRPTVGILQPAQALEIVVGVSRKHSADPPGVILLRYVKLPGDWSPRGDLAAFWSSAPKGKVKALKLVQRVFEPDPTNYSMHSSFSGASSAHGSGSPVLEQDSESRYAASSYAPSSSAMQRLSDQIQADVSDQRYRPSANYESAMQLAGSGVVVPPPLADAASDPAPRSQPQVPGSQQRRVVEMSQTHHANMDSMISTTSFVPVDLNHSANTHADASSEDMSNAGPRSDSRASTLSDYSHRTDEPASGLDLDMVEAVQRLRAAVSSVKDRQPFDPLPYTHRKPRVKDSGLSGTSKSSAEPAVAESSSISQSSAEFVSPNNDAETSSAGKRSRYPPVTVSVSSISRVMNGEASLMQRLFPSAELSHQPIFVKMDSQTLQLSEGNNEDLLLLLRWKDVIAMSVRTDSSVATLLLLLHGNSGNPASCFRDIKVCDSLVSDVYHTQHIMSIKGSADTICRMALHATRCPGNSVQPLPHWLWIAAQCRFPGSTRFRALLCNSALSLPHSPLKFLLFMMLALAICTLIFSILSIEPAADLSLAVGTGL